MSTIKVYETDSEEYKKLENYAKLLNRIGNKHNFMFKVGNTYFDFGQNWKWTTILAKYPGDKEFRIQFLTPAEHEKIILELDTIENLLKHHANEMIKTISGKIDLVLAVLKCELNQTLNEN